MPRLYPASLLAALGGGSSLTSLGQLATLLDTHNAILFGPDGVPKAAPMTLFSHYLGPKLYQPTTTLPAIVLQVPGATEAGTTVTFTASLLNYGTQPALQLATDGGAYAALPAPNFTPATGAPTSVQFQLTLSTVQGGHTLQLRDGNNVASNQLSYTVTPVIPAADFTGVAGLAAWYRPSDATTVTSASGVVSQVNDISANARHAIASTAGPTIAASAVNGLQALAFTGTNQALKIDALAPVFSGVGAALHWFVVLSATAADLASTDYLTALALDAASPAQDWQDAMSLSVYNGNANFARIATVGGTGALVPITAAQFYVVEGVYDMGQPVGSRAGIAINGGAFNYRSGDTDGDSAITFATGRIGARTGVGGAEGHYFGGAIAEIAMLQGAVSATDRTAHLRYLNTRYALGLSV